MAGSMDTNPTSPTYGQLLGNVAIPKIPGTVNTPQGGMSMASAMPNGNQNALSTGPAPKPILPPTSISSTTKTQAPASNTGAPSSGIDTRVGSPTYGQLINQNKTQTPPASPSTPASTEAYVATIDGLNTGGSGNLSAPGPVATYYDKSGNPIMTTPQGAAASGLTLINPAASPLAGSNGASAGNQSASAQGTTPMNSELNAIYAKYGVTPPASTPTTPNLNPVTLPDYTQTPAYGIASAEIGNNLQNSIQAINQKYGVQTQQATEANTNQLNSALGGMAAAGENSAFGSSTASLQGLAQKNLALETAAINSAQSTDVTNAQNASFAQQQTENAQAEAVAEAQEQATMNNNAQLQQSWDNAWTNINNGVALVNAGQSLSQTEQNDNLDRLSSMLTTFGSAALNNIPSTELDAIGQAAGLPAGALQNGLQTMKEKELYGKLNLKQMFDGSLVNVSIGSDGKPDMQVLLPGSMSNIVSGIEGGTIPPDMSGYSSEQKTALTNQLAEDGFNLSAATEDWTATTAYLKTANDQQITRLRQSITAIPQMADTVTQLASQWQSSNFPVLNAVQLTAARNGLLGPQAATIANSMSIQIADMVGDLATIEQGGGTAGNEAFEQAKQMLQSNWTADQLTQAINLIKTNTTIRQNSLNNSGVGGVSAAGNPYNPTASANTSTPTGSVSNVTWDNLLGNGT